MKSPIPAREPDESLTDYLNRVNTLVFSNPATPAPEFDQDLIPEEDHDAERFAQERLEISAVLDRINIVDAYNKYTNKQHCEPGGKRESIVVRCPFPWHADEHPSAWLTLDKGDGGVGNCGTCGGFDKYDIAAAFYGFDVPGYKEGANYPRLRQQMAEGLGYTVMVQGKVEWLVKSQPTTPSNEPTTPNQSPLDESPEYLHPEFLDWQILPFITPGTFMHTWMTETSRAHQPEEFYLFAGFAALGLAVGNKVQLDDETRVRPNTMICLVGGTGTGKSRSVHQLRELLHEALPFHEDTAAGVRWIHSPGSGEDLVNQMIYTTTDSVTKDVTYHPVRGLFYEDEFEALMARVNRAHSTMRGYLMRFFDSQTPVSKSSQTHGTAIAKEHYMQMLTTTQPKRLSALLTEGDASSGFLNRWLFPFGTEKFRPAISDVRIDVKPAAKLLQMIRAWSSPERLVHLDFDPVTVALWNKFVQSKIRPLEATDDVLVARIELQCKKLLLLMAINDKSTTVLESHIRSLMLMFPYLKHCYGFVEKTIGITKLEECVEAVRKYFETHPNDDITMRVLAKQSGAHKFDTADRAKATELLEKTGEIMQVPTPRNHHTIKWRYVQSPDPPLATVTPIK